MTLENSFSPEEMEVLRGIFLSSSNQCLDAMRGILDAWPEGGPGEERLKQFHRAAHSVKGAAMQIGYLPIGELARELERAVLALLAGAPADESWRRAAEQACAILGDDLEALRAGREMSPPDQRLLRELKRLGGAGAAQGADRPAAES
ncbi:MAG: Hpt domain-containing protein [Candidatus Eisenbacteria bacterium]|uniref:Hpt domain-containing protein n=1 Tax=Eiseniibacteriota bacterium TaxID=2212470 RepID=A0A938BQ72_UNCEI|nr:Hpt domain-containing protein [Candidatus Eisenbacteria bacterium]